MTPNTFVFDVAGVLLDWNPEPYYREFFAGDDTRYDFFFSRVMDSDAQNAISAGQLIADVLAERRSAHPDYAAALDAWQSDWKSLLRGDICGTVAALGELRERGHRTFALGNWSREEFNAVVDDYAFLSEFDDVLLSGDCGVLKPDPQIFALAEDKFGLEPANTVFIDDRADNVQTAIDRGWNGLVFENPRQLYLVLMEYQIL